MRDSFIPVTSIASGLGQEVAPDVYALCVQVVNLCFVGDPLTKKWVLVDAGMPRSTPDILAHVGDRFGQDARPEAIILTHGHFDHIGAVQELSSLWDVPVYAHELEKPYLDGTANYPEPDSTVEGGMVAKMSPMFPNGGIDLGHRLRVLPPDGTVPHMPGWRWIHTPGHAPGHISLFREEDRTLIAGDAFVTVRQDSLYQVLTQTVEISGPPRYLTTDWEAAKESVIKLEALRPACAITGHGFPVYGEQLSSGLARLVRDFDSIAVPDYGRYVEPPSDAAQPDAPLY
ncbi:MBL fold metallo-hydrolase [Brevibacillus composti]|uniref:MBL fold metallo-hydrolase n=1 Tax=Brevibacillus composti TaxID=2796470 RepID=A0A7T5JNY9_9BACL|nr:MBL fold metallo-hydrolase [Brevibacillus composti]QQE74923.1 MBL fold metallo-hydrolase [Brevibacillus composti]QUO42008.1 MBL fold metallo-hydrolase [Brevibacillus composti]